jgi:hypothetical protein
VIGIKRKIEIIKYPAPRLRFSQRSCCLKPEDRKNAKEAKKDPYWVLGVGSTERAG